MWLGGELGGDVFAGGKAAEPARRNMPLMVYFFGRPTIRMISPRRIIRQAEKKGADDDYDDKG